MVVLGPSPAGFEAHAESYFATGYSGIEAFLDAAKGFDIRLFEPNPAVSIDSGRITCTKEERHEGKRGLLAWLMQSFEMQAIDYFEFGVLDCRTFNRVIETTPHRKARFYGFDTFEGLPEPWVRQAGKGGVRIGRGVGDLKAVRAPAVYDARAVLFKGLFQDALPGALDRAFPKGRQENRPLLVNIDSDLYTSALYVLTSMHALLRSGDYVYLDEFFDAMNEFAAFNDYVRSYGSKAWFVPVARAYDGMLFRIALPPLAPDAAAIVDRRSTSFLERMKAHARARLALRKPADPGRGDAG